MIIFLFSLKKLLTAGAVFSFGSRGITDALGTDFGTGCEADFGSGDGTGFDTAFCSGRDASFAPHCSQNNASSSFSAPHRGQRKPVGISIFLPQFPQNKLPSVTSYPQFGHFIGQAPFKTRSFYIPFIYYDIPNSYYLTNTE
jgi:hypothetical protein